MSGAQLVCRTRIGLNNNNRLGRQSIRQPACQQSRAHSATANQNERARGADLTKICHGWSLGLSDRLQQGHVEGFVGFLAAPDNELEGRKEPFTFRNRDFDKVFAFR